MTPREWYQLKLKEYNERYQNSWTHLSMFGENQDSEVCETALRAGVECAYFKPTGMDEIEMIANAMMIRDFLKACKNSSHRETV